jgi:hypothetical protein
MANAVNYLSQIQTGQTIKAVHVNQFVDAMSGSQAYDLVTSGSYTIIGPLYATASWATNAINAQSASKEYVALNSSTNAEYTLVFKNSTGALNNYYELGADGSNGPYYNPSTNTLTVPVISGSSAKVTSFTGSLLGDVNGSSSYATTASYALTSSYAAASSITTYTTGAYNGSTIYPQGTIYTKYENTLVSQSAVSEYDLLSATTTYAGSRALASSYCVNPTTQPKVLKFHIKGYIPDMGGLGTPAMNTYIKIGSTTIAGSALGSVDLPSADDNPFEIDYELVFVNNMIYACGGIGWCKNSDYHKVAFSNLYTPQSAIGVSGVLQFIVSGSSNIRMTGSLASVEFIN